MCASIVVVVAAAAARRIFHLCPHTPDVHPSPARVKVM